jgi:histidinol phosphatase-like PHP family hydrolase
MGIPRAGILEHADQLYAPRDGFWERLDANDTRVQRQCQANGQARHEAFRRRIGAIHSPRIRFGLEIEPAADGHGLGVLDEDRQGYDYLIGAVHHLGGLEKTKVTQKELEFAFLAATRQLLASGVDILAHPLRFFPKKCQLPEPRDLYPPLLEMLMETGVAAEINFHAHVPDPEFFAQCIRRGIKISLGSDSHSLVQVGDLHPHLELIKQIGAIGRLDEILWPPPRHDD